MVTFIRLAVEWSILGHGVPPPARGVADPIGAGRAATPRQVPPPTSTPPSTSRQPACRTRRSSHHCCCPSGDPNDHVVAGLGSPIPCAPAASSPGLRGLLLGCRAA